jgi:hypothetical protein
MSGLGKSGSRMNSDWVLDDRLPGGCYHPVCVGREIFQARRAGQTRAMAVPGTPKERFVKGAISTEEYTPGSQVSGE